MSRLARYRILVGPLVILAASAPLIMAADGAIASRPPTSTPYILVGFAGGFVRRVAHVTTVNPF